MATKKKKWEVNVLAKIDHKLQWTKFVHSGHETIPKKYWPQI